MFVEVAGAGKAVGKLAYDAAVAFPVGAHRIPIASVPFRPADRKVADLVTLPQGPRVRQST